VRYLIDINVWVALLDEAHVFHAQALAFFEQPKLKIASCAITENGVIRILNLPNYSKRGPAGFIQVQQKLKSICEEIDHMFWPDRISLRDEGIVNWSRVLGHGQITDIYLLALAVAHNGCLITLDHRVALSTVVGATSKNLKLL
jgi:uncharacterized protein